LGLFEIIIILAVALIVLGPERMPEVIRLVVRIVREVRTAANEAMREITEAMEQEVPPAQQQTEHPPPPLEIQPSAPPEPGPPPEIASAPDSVAPSDAQPAPPSDKDRA
jgi:sec-independent protein translocase protein TatB